MKKIATIFTIGSLCLILASCNLGRSAKETVSQYVNQDKSSSVDKGEALDFTPAPFDLGDIEAKFAQDISYDEYDETKLDIFLPDSEEPTGLVIYIHGGGFKTGDKSKLYASNGDQNLIKELLSENIAIASINYRLVTEDDEDGILKCLNDSKRALQFIRYYSDDFNIRKEDVALMGGSAGSGTSLWIAVNDDMKDINSPDPVLRESTRVKGIAVSGVQATYDFALWSSVVFAEFDMDMDDMAELSNSTNDLPMYGSISYMEFESPEVIEYRNKVDMLSQISADDPEIWASSTGTSNGAPQTQSDRNHHGYHVKAIMEKADEVGVDMMCEYGNPIVYQSENFESRVEFLIRKVNEEKNSSVDGNNQSTNDDELSESSGSVNESDAIGINEIPFVKAESTYTVLIDEDITYANGLSHDKTSTSSFAMPLKLDVYYPDYNSTNRPVFMFIHGGGFKGGIKHKPEIIEMANYYASRGWVFVSIDYRTVEELGTIKGKKPEELLTFYKGMAPQEWIEHGLQGAATSEQVQQGIAMYLAQRDAKAALRWIVANSNTYSINTDYITVGGASAGAISAVALGISNQEDFRDEISIADDPTLSTTNLNETYTVRSLVHFWGSTVLLDVYEAVYDLEQYDRYDSGDPELFMGHGEGRDPVTPYEEALEFQSIYDSLGVHSELATLLKPNGDPAGHGAWNAQVDGKGLFELTFDFLIERQALNVQ